MFCVGYQTKTWYWLAWRLMRQGMASSYNRASAFAQSGGRRRFVGVAVTALWTVLTVYGGVTGIRYLAALDNVTAKRACL